MVHVPAGTFVMGNDKEGAGDRPAHRVTITHAFYIDRTEVTAEAYAACVAEGACSARNNHVKRNITSTYACNIEKDRASHPANCVDREQAERFCKFAKKRLPTEAEWEYAARGSDERDYPWGKAPPTGCNFGTISALPGPCGQRKGTSPVGLAPDGASPFGALDMAGNVWEWTNDKYASYSADDVTDPHVRIDTRPDGPTQRGVIRGGSWDYSVASAKTTFRLPFPVDTANASVGFRCVRDEGK
jgi:eukaryotic-like serine/threonine-protein kinase